MNCFLDNREKAIVYFKYIGPISLLLFIFPCFLSAYFYEKFIVKVSKKNILNALRLSCAWSFVIQAGVVFAFMYFKKVSYHILIPVFNGVIAMIVALGSFLIYYLIQNKPKNIVNRATFVHSKKAIFLITIILSLFFVLLLASTGSTIIKGVYLFLALFIKSIIASFIVAELFQYIYATKNGVLRKLLIILTYMVVIIAFTLNYSEFSLYQDSNYLRRSVFSMLTLRTLFFSVMFSYSFLFYIQYK